MKTTASERRQLRRIQNNIETALDSLRSALTNFKAGDYESCQADLDDARENAAFGNDLIDSLRKSVSD